jgi:hypothetical protein
VAKLEVSLKATAEDIEKKEAQESEILEAYYATRAYDLFSSLCCVVSFVV